MVNGAVRTFGTMPRSLPDPRPVAFLASSPEPPGDDGYTETSFGAMARPMLINSGIGDDTSVFGEDRARVFDLMPAGDKYRLFLGEEAARGSAEARAYLASDNLAVLSGGAATWSRK